MSVMDSPHGSMIKNLPANREDMGSIPGQEDSACCWATKPVLQLLDSRILDRMPSKKTVSPTEPN